ncbi:MAG: glycoside hydrolase, partial [FCB group bacterium]|nr:glycoside hydrolase [FCB group bacterium]
MSQEKPVKLAILWHMHQPNYQLSNSKKMIMPWVRLHALKDYLDMPLMASKYENVKVTFNLVPSLIDQIELYLNGGTDPHLELSRINAEQLNKEQKLEILETFFAGHPQTMIKPYPHFYALYKKARNNHHHDILPSLFSSDEMRDIQVWSNLIWVDPMFREKQPVKSLLAKEKHFTEEEKHAFLDWQLN